MAVLFPSWLTHLPIDLFVIVIFLFIVTFDALRSGPGRASVLALAFPISVFLSNLSLHTVILGNVVASVSSPAVKAASFLAIFVIVYILAYRIVYTLGSGSSGFFFALLAGISAAIITIVTWLQAPALTGLWSFSPAIQTVFGSSYALLWIFLAYLILAFTRS